MTIRTNKRTLTFESPFVLGDMAEVFPAGDYFVETDEELLEGVSFNAYRRISTQITLRANPKKPGTHRVLTIDPNELDAARERDQKPTDFGPNAEIKMSEI